MSAFSEERLQELLPKLLDEDEDIRYEAATEILRMGRPVLPLAIGWLEAPNPRLREMACFFLGQLGEPDPTKPFTRTRYREAVAPLVQTLQDPADTVRASAIDALGHHADLTTIPSLLPLVSDASEDVRHSVAVTLGSFYGCNWDEASLPLKPAVEAALLRLMDDPDEDVRDWATFGIHQGGHDTPVARARLWQALDDPDPDVRGEAAEGLATFGDRAVIPRLEQLLQGKELSPCYFLAAEKLGDPALLPALEEAADRWEAEEGPGDERLGMIRSAIHALRESSAGSAPQSQHS